MVDKILIKVKKKKDEKLNYIEAQVQSSISSIFILNNLEF